MTRSTTLLNAENLEFLAFLASIIGILIGLFAIFVFVKSYYELSRKSKLHKLGSLQLEQFHSLAKKYASIHNEIIQIRMNNSNVAKYKTYYSNPIVVHVNTGNIITINLTMSAQHWDLHNRVDRPTEIVSEKIGKVDQYDFAIQ